VERRAVYLRTGKRLARHLTTVAIHFRAAPQQLFPSTPGLDTANILTLRIAPDPRDTIQFRAKARGR